MKAAVSNHPPFGIASFLFDMFPLTGGSEAHMSKNPCLLQNQAGHKGGNATADNRVRFLCMLDLLGFTPERSCEGIISYSLRKFMVDSSGCSLLMPNSDYLKIFAH